MMRILSVALLVLGLVSTGAAQPEAVDLRPQWEPGQTSRYHFTTTRTQRTTMTGGGQSETIDSTVATEGEVTWHVQDARSDGSYLCAMTLDWMTAQLTGPDGQTQRNDSRRGSGDTPPIHDLLRAMTGTRLTVRVAPDGSITSVEGVDAMRSKAQHPDMIPEELDFIESASDLATLPGAPASLLPGRTWDIAFQWTHEMGHLHQDATYRLTGVEEIADIPVAMVEGSAKVRLEVDRSSIPDDAPPIDVRLSSASHASQIMFDLTRHEAVGRSTVDARTIDVTIRLPTPPGPLTRRIEETITSQTLRIAEE